MNEEPQQENHENEGRPENVPPVQSASETEGKEGAAKNKVGSDEASSSAPSASSPSREPTRKVCSERKIAANRNNARNSTGPRTKAGKARSAANSYKHGFFYTRMFPTMEHVVKDRPDYEKLVRGIYEDYQPATYMEHFWAEKICTEALRLARLIDYEQSKLLSWRAPYEAHSADRILRFQNAANRRMAEAFKELERLQSKRKAEETKMEPEDGEEADDSEEPPAPAARPEEPSAEETAAEVAAPATNSASESAIPSSQPDSSSSSASTPKTFKTNPPQYHGCPEPTDEELEELNSMDDASERNEDVARRPRTDSGSVGEDELLDLC